MAALFGSVIHLSVLGVAFSACPQTTPGLKTWSRNKTSDHNTASWKDGINAYIFDSKTGSLIKYANYYLGEYEKWHYKSNPIDLANLINSAKFDNIVMLAVQNNLIEPRVDLKPAYEAIETLTQGRVQKGDVYAMVIQKGDNFKMYN